MFLLELIEVVGYHTAHQLLQPRVVLALNLQQQTLLQRLRAYSCRVEVL